MVKKAIDKHFSRNQLAIFSIAIGIFALLWCSGLKKVVMQNLDLNSNHLIAIADRTNKPAKFPEVSGFNLLSEKFNLPGEFAAPYNVVILAYTQHQQYDVYTWLPLLQQLESDFANLRYYELPTLKSYDPIMRSRIDGWMREGIPDRNTRSRTITMYLDVESFNQALKIENNQQIRILLVTPEGEILWQEKGAFSKQKGEELQKHLKLIQKSSLNVLDPLILWFWI